MSGGIQAGSLGHSEPFVQMILASFLIPCSTQDIFNILATLRRSVCMLLGIGAEPPFLAQMSCNSWAIASASFPCAVIAGLRSIPEQRT